MIAHHPADDLLLAFAAGTASPGFALVVASHVEDCAHCRGRVAVFDAVGGAMLDELAPATLAPDAFARTLAVIDAAPVQKAGAPAPAYRPPLPASTEWPMALRACSVTPWRWLGPGVRWSRVTLPADRTANVFLLRIAAGMKMPPHTHSDVELTQVLCGSFHDGRALFGRGDFDAADGSIRHQPVVEPDGECISLACVSGKVVFESALARMLGAVVGI